MFKVMIFVRRKAGLTKTEFAELFERNHVGLVRQMVTAGKVPAMADYRRNYFVEADPHNTMEAEELGFDAVMESVFATREEFEQTRNLPRVDPQVAALLQEDYARLVAEDGVRYMVVNEITGGGTAAPA